MRAERKKGIGKKQARIYSQSEGCRDSLERRVRAVQAHESILDAIIDRDAPRAQVEMEAHLRYSASRKLKDQSSSDQYPRGTIQPNPADLAVS